MSAMRTHYLDASAIVKLLVDEDGSAVIREYFQGQSIFHTTSFCFAETLGVLKVKCFQRKEISENEYSLATWHLLSLIGDKSIEIEDNTDIWRPDVFVAIREIVRKYSFDFSDAFQLYTMKQGMLSIFGYESTPILITADEKLARAAFAEGLRSWDCMKEPEPSGV